MTPHTFLARLCALVPPPGAHTVRYYGVLAGHHALRARIIPRPEEPPPRKQLALFVPQRGGIRPVRAAVAPSPAAHE